MKSMEQAYRRKAGDLLGLSERDTARPAALPNDRRGWLLDAAGRVCPPPASDGFAPAALPAALESLRPFCRSAAASRGELWLELGRPREALALLRAQNRLLEPLAGRLDAFLALRPCFEPALRPGLALLLDRDSGEARPAALLREGYGSAPEGFVWPLSFNLELTTQCPLRCPQCYVHLQEGRHMPREIALRRLDQAGALGACVVNLSGGETMCYPWLFEIIERARAFDIEPDVALSGFGVNNKSLDALIGAGVNGVYVSLNGPTPEINARTRDGYELALSLLERLRQRRFPHTWINWVVHDSNADTLPEMLRLAERFEAEGLMVMAFKPDSRNALPSLPDRTQMETLSRQIRDYRGPVDLCVEPCYSSLRALNGKSFAGNRNRGPFRGCGAGRSSFSVALDGRFTPCRHIDVREDWDSLEDYWEQSPLLRVLRKNQAAPTEPCLSCPLRDSCRHCMAINWKLNGSLTRGDATCPLRESEELPCQN